MTNNTSNFEKSFKRPFKTKDLPIPTTFTPCKKDYPAAEPQVAGVKLSFGHLNYRSTIRTLLYASCCMRPDVIFEVNKVTKFSSDPGVIHFTCLLLLFGYVKKISKRGLKL